MRRLNFRIHIVLIAVVMLLAASTPGEARVAGARPAITKVEAEGSATQSSWWQRFMQKLLRARYAMAAN